MAPGNAARAAMTNRVAKLGARAAPEQPQSSPRVAAPPLSIHLSKAVGTLTPRLPKNEQKQNKLKTSWIKQEYMRLTLIRIAIAVLIGN